MVGTGGIGSGSFFQVTGNATLGREESRGGRFLDRRDYCKLHIVSHYVKGLLGDGFPVFPVGSVGADDAGRRLVEEMRDAGLDLRFVDVVPGASTLFSFCFLYPDGTGGNMTTEDSASSRVGPAGIERAAAVIEELGSAGIALAVPEVPIAARRALLEAAGRHGLFRAASFTRAEIPDVRRSGLLGKVDLLAVNLEEAAAAAGLAEAAAARSADESASAACAALAREHPSLLVSVTAGSRGSWAWDGSALVHDPAIPVRAEGTAGAGDAHLAGLLCGLATGLPLAGALQVATIVAAASVTSPHAIHPSMSRGLLAEVSGARAMAALPAVCGLFAGPENG
jgi:sugar/nucleoside kinase (ribokinase family)